jgi:hypothetical protein
MKKLRLKDWAAMRVVKMKKLRLKDWAAIAEVIGTTAVVISLALVIASIRQNTAAIQAANENFVYDLNDRYWSDRINNPEIYENWDKMLSGKPLSVSEEGQIYDLVLRAMNGWENIYVKYRSGLLSEEQFDNWHEANADWLRRRVPISLWERMDGPAISLWERMDGPEWRLDFEDRINEIYESM